MITIVAVGRHTLLGYTALVVALRVHCAGPYETGCDQWGAWSALELLGGCLDKADHQSGSNFLIKATAAADPLPLQTTLHCQRHANADSLRRMQWIPRMPLQHCCWEGIHHHPNKMACFFDRDSKFQTNRLHSTQKVQIRNSWGSSGRGTTLNTSPCARHVQSIRTQGSCEVEHTRVR